MMDVLAMVLVGGRGTRLEQMTKNTAKPAVPFLGKYKLIDFVLSNLTHSNIDTVGIVTQYEPQELMQYIGRGASWDLDRTGGGISFLTPFSNIEGEQFQKGTADAIRQHRSFITRNHPEYVLVLSGDHVYKMNYQGLVDKALETNADMVIGTFKPSDHLSRYGIIEASLNGEVKGFSEKPDTPKSHLASMGVYVFKKDVLLSLLDHLSLNDFGSDIIPLALSLNKKVIMHLFEGYFRDVGTVKALYQANMEILNDPSLIDLYEDSMHPLYANSTNLPPHHVASIKSVSNSFIADGSLILGNVVGSIIAHGCLIKDDATIKDSIIHPNVTIGEYAVIENAIILEDTVVLPKTKLLFKEPTLVDNETLWQLGAFHD